MAPDEDVRFEVRDAFAIIGRGIVLNGWMASGIIRVGDALALVGGGRSIPIRILEIEAWHRPGLQEATVVRGEETPYTRYAFIVSGLKHRSEVQPGDTVTRA